MTRASAGHVRPSCPLVQRLNAHAPRHPPVCGPHHSPPEPICPGRCQRTTAAADIQLPVAALGAGYLGGVRLGALGTAGLITECRKGALAVLSAAMYSDPAPWCPSMF